MIVTKTDLLNIASIIKEHEFNYCANIILNYADDLITTKETDINKVSAFFDKKILKSASIQKKIHSYFLEKKLNIGELYEKKLQYSIWDSDLLLAYSRFINNKLYYPKNESVIFDIIKEHKSNNNQTFWIFVSMAESCKDDKISLDSFAHILKEKTKYQTLSLLEIEKFKKIWDKRYEGVDIQSISPETFEIAKPYFDSIHESKNKDFFSVEKGYFQKFTIDNNILSQSNRLTLGKNRDAIHTFFTNFKVFTKTKTTANDIFSISDFNFNTSTKTTLIISYNDPKKEKLIQSLMADLIDYATSKEDNNNLKGSKPFSSNETNNFFETFLNHYALNFSLPKKEDLVANKKNKI